MSYRSLFDGLSDLAVLDNWAPEAPRPIPADVTEVYFNVETNGLRWWDGDRPISVAYGYDTPSGFVSQFLPFGFKGGGNLPEQQVKDFALHELKGKYIRGTNTRFDIHHSREWGVDLEAMGCTVSDVSHYVALLDDHRKRFALDILIPDLLHEAPMARVDESRMETYHAGQVAARAQYQVDILKRLKDVLWPRLDAEGLQKVRALEDQVIFVVCEMEKNGAPIDVELLERWLKQSQAEINTTLMEIGREAGYQLNPDSPGDMERLFKKLQLPIEKTAKGSPSFTDAILKRIEHPLIKKIRRVGKLMSLRSKYLVKYQKSVDSKGILRYALHQLRAAKDERADAGEAGTISGRFSSTAIADDYGINIQQEMKVAKQRVAFGYDEDDASHDDEIYVIRKLRVPQSGVWLSADAMQIEYRMFAHYANNPKIVAAYEQDPEMSFHKFVHGMLKPYRPSLTYRECKDCNFANLYGAKLLKLALMLGYITAAQWEELKRKRDWKSPLLTETREIKQIYDREMPEVEELLADAGHLAKSECDDWCFPSDPSRRDYRAQMEEAKKRHARLEHRGYVKTILGRRTRFPDGQRLHKALNGVIQGGAADIMKQKLVEVHAARRDTGFLLRYTVHDELDGDAQQPETEAKIKAILNRQSFKLRVPILWDVSTGKNWAEC